MWRSNPDADYSGVVDTPRVFEFIDSFHGSGDVWTFSFTNAEDIVDTLRQQFAYLVQDALGLRQMAHGHGRLLEELDGDALMVALRRDPHWEYRLFGTVLEAELDRRAPLRSEIKYRLAQADVTHIDLNGVRPWVLDRTHEFSGFTRTVTAIIHDYLPQAVGDKGCQETRSRPPPLRAALPRSGRTSPAGHCAAARFASTLVQNVSLICCQPRTPTYSTRSGSLGTALSHASMKPSKGTRVTTPEPR